MDVCPVGAITTRDYRFKARPWDNPTVVDTTCTLCAKGCSTSAWLKAKPEWAKGAQLIRMTPRFNPDVNGYWMCDIGRFQYHWIEGESRLRKPMLRQGAICRRWRGTTSSRGCATGIAAGRVGRSRVGALPGVGPRLHRGALRPEGARRGPGGRRGPQVGDDDLDAQRQAAAGRQRSSRFRRSMRPTSTARATSASTSATAQTPNLAGLRSAVAAGKVRVLYVLEPGPGRFARRHVVDRRGAPRRDAARRSSCRAW